MATKKPTVKAEVQGDKELETLSTQDEKNTDVKSAEAAPAPEATLKDSVEAENAFAAPVPGQDEHAPLVGLDELQMRFRAPGWQHAALLRYQGWERGKQVSEAEYARALQNIGVRPQGGGRAN